MRIRKLVLVAQLLLATSLWGQAPGPSHDVSLDSLLNTPVSTAAKYAQTSREAAASVTIITDEEIQSFGYRTIADVLAAIPGFYASDDRQFTAIGVRGFGRPSDYNNRILLLIDGNTVNDNVTGAAAVGPDMPFDLGVVDHIEVVRGPGSALYGTGAVFAVINVVTKTGRAFDGLRLSSTIGSFGRRGVAAVAGGARQGVDFTASALYDQSDGQRLAFPELAIPPLSDGVANRRDGDRRVALLGVVRTGGLTLVGRFSNRDADIPVGGYGSGWGRFRSANSAAVARYERDLTAHQSVTARIYLHWFRGNGRFPVAPGVAYDLHFASNARGAEIAWRWDPASFSRLTVGAEYVNYPVVKDLTSVSGVALRPVSRPNSLVSLYLQEYFTIAGRLSLVGGLRGGFYSDGRSVIAPRAGVIYQASRATSLKLLYGESMRVPTAVEDAAVSNDPGAESLEPERVKTLEAIWDQRLAPWLQGSLSAFVFDGDNFIYEVTDSTSPQISYANYGQVNTKGIEASFRSSLPQGFRGYAGLELVRAEDEITKARLTNSPASTIKLGLSRPVMGIDIAAEFRHEAGRLNAHGGSTSPYSITNLTLSRRLGSPRGFGLGAVGQRMDLMVQVRNLFNESYRVPAALSLRQSTFLQDGRSVWVRLGYRF